MPQIQRLSFVLFLLLIIGCNKSKPAEEAAAAVSVPLDSAAGRLHDLVASPKAGDVYVVQFQPPGAAQKRYFFYHLFRVTADSAYLHPARKDVADAAADLTQPELQASTTIIAYTRAELADLLKEQPGDVNKAQVTQVRRAE